MKKYGEIDFRKLRDECSFDFGHFTYPPNMCSCCYGPTDLPDCYWAKGKEGKEKALSGEKYSYFLFKNAYNGSGSVTKADAVDDYTCISYRVKDLTQKEKFSKLLSEQLGSDYVVNMTFDDGSCVVIRSLEEAEEFRYGGCTSGLLYCNGEEMTVCNSVFCEDGKEYEIIGTFETEELLVVREKYSSVVQLKEKG